MSDRDPFWREPNKTPQCAITSEVLIYPSQRPSFPRGNGNIVGVHMTLSLEELMESTLPESDDL